ncbi:MAG: acetyl-CoA C-acyltransferase [Phycisphaerales bacterium]|jgi:3-oxoadipyl-CoA thiolase|nr:acetyl-CoA C-acyltransferase [Phycisphaerales bacterium]
MNSFNLRKAAIVSAVRTPIGRYGGGLSTVRPDDLAALVIEKAVDKSRIDKLSIDDVYFGATNQAGEDNRNVARMASLLAGLPVTVPGATVNRLCASGLESLIIAARMIETNCADVIVAGGVESMSRAPFVMPKSKTSFDRHAEIYDTTIGWRFINPKMAEMYSPIGMGQTAENVARKWNITREDQDSFAYESQQKWKQALDGGKWNDEIIQVCVPQRHGESIIVDTDEHPRPETSLEKLSTLKPAFSKEDGASVTAGNSSGINDGAAAIVLVELEQARELGLNILGVIGASATAGVEPDLMGIGPVKSSEKLFAKTGVTAEDIDIVELNEAFAAQAIACIRELNLDPSKVNPNGGAIAMGHPLGCTGARIVVTLVHEMNRTNTKLGMASLCVGIGQGVSMFVERE